MVSSVATEVWQNLFAPPLERRQEAPPKDAFDHVSEYTASATGAWEVFYVIDHALSYVKMIPGLPQAERELIRRTTGVINSIGLALSIPAVFSDLNTLRHSVARLIESHQVPRQEILRDGKCALAARDVLLDTLALANDLTYIPALIDHLKISIVDPKLLQISDGLYSASSIVLDGFELIGECYKLNQYYSAVSAPLTPLEEEVLQEKKWLSWLHVAKGVSSVALSIIALAGLAFGIAIEGIGVIAMGVIVLSTFWLIIKIAAYFYDQIVVAPRSKPGLINVQI